jgi:mono/diheme cytochrome c family protein
MRRRRALLAACAALLAACDGDYFPFERTAREAFNGWDMWDDEAVGPHQAPMPRVPAGAVPMDAPRRTLTAAEQQRAALSVAQRRRQGALAYRRYCHHCHGPSGDGRIIVGESFTPALPDLRKVLVDREDREIAAAILGGTRKMVALDDTLTPLETLLALEHARSLRGAPSRPFFPPRSTEPIQ